MKNRAEMAVAKFLDGYNCAQSVLYAFCDEFGLDRNVALKLSCGFGAGMGRKQEVCGAISGAIMVVGLKYGRGEAQGREATERTYAMTQELIDRFREKHGTFLCRELLVDCDLSTPQGLKQFEERKLRSERCAPLVRDAVEILDAML
jgi:C_GCAxxG_C_C family probable redox protein